MSDQQKIRTLLQEAADEALAAQVASLYKVYLSHTTGSTGTQRKATAQGLERAIDAYRVLVSAAEAWSG